MLRRERSPRGLQELLILLDSSLHREVPKTLSKASRLIFLPRGVILPRCFAPNASAVLLREGGEQDAQPLDTLLAPAPLLGEKMHKQKLGF